MDAVRYWDRALVEEPDRVGRTKTVGVDETKFLAARRRKPTRWASGICDFDRRTVIDVIQGRQGPDLDHWLAHQPEAWRAGIEITVTDLHEPFRAALGRGSYRLTGAGGGYHPSRLAQRPRR